MGIYCEFEAMENESDVEQKFVYEMLTFPKPQGLSYKATEIHTKSVLRRKLIGKGTCQKYYYPDYLVVLRGFPIVVIEVKNPGEDLQNAYAEARLYAAEVNAQFGHGMNTCQFIIVSNGYETWAGYYDQGEPEYMLHFDDFFPENKKFGDLMEFCSREKAMTIASKPYKNARGGAYFNTPVSKLGGRRTKNEELLENTFGRILVFENGGVFDPRTEEERKMIVKNAYIESKKRTQHIEPIYREIKKAEVSRDNLSTQLSTDNPIQLVDKLK